MIVQNKTSIIATAKWLGKLLSGRAACLILGLALGAGGYHILLTYNPPDPEPSLSPTTVFDRVVAQNEMVSVSQVYSVVDKAKDTNSFFGVCDIPFTENGFWYRYTGTLKAGINIKEAECDWAGNVVTITLSEPYVIGNTPNFDKTGVLEEQNNILNPIHVKDVDAFQAYLSKNSEIEAVQNGLLVEARGYAEKNIKDMFIAAFGDQYEVRVLWKESSNETVA